MRRLWRIARRLNHAEAVPGDRFDLQRFVTAQDAGSTYERALGELRAGRKTSHWMWFVFPQLRGLGRSPTAQLYGIDGINEARAYLDHPVLGPRFLECVEAVAAAEGRTAVEIFGTIDTLKLRSSMTLFARAATDPTPFTAVITHFFDGEHDPRTDELLGLDEARRLRGSGWDANLDEMRSDRSD